MKKIILIGAGGHCRSCIDVIKSTERYLIVGIINKDKASQKLFVNKVRLFERQKVNVAYKDCFAFL